jgi:hypothetical protein
MFEILSRINFKRELEGEVGEKIKVDRGVKSGGEKEYKK